MTMSVTQEMFDKCCEITAGSSLGLVHVCGQVGCTYKAMRYYIDSSENNRARYARAKEDQADYMADEMIEIADDGSNDLMTIVKGENEYEIENKEVTNRSKLRVDTRKWIAARLKPGKYGDKIDVTTNGESISRELTITSIPTKTAST